MVKDFTKEDIPVLGRLVSISEDNTIANAEQIWDARQNKNQGEINQSFNNRISLVEGGSSLTQEQKNILRFIQEYSTIYQYTVPEDYDDAFEVNNLWLRYDNANLQYTDSDISLDRNSSLQITSTFNSNYGYTSALFISAIKASGVTAPKYAIYVTHGDCKFNDDLMVEGTIRSIEGFETQEGSVTAWDGIFENSIISRGGCIDRLSVGGNGVPSGNAIFTVDGQAYFEEGFSTEGDCSFATDVIVGGNATFQNDIILNGGIQVQSDQFSINDMSLDDYIAEKGVCVLEYDQEIDEDTLRKISSGQTTVLKQVVVSHTANRVYFYPEVKRLVSRSNLTIQWAQPIEIDSNVSCDYYSYTLEIIFGQTNNIVWSTESNGIDFLTMLNGKQNTLSAGSGISIDSNNVISCTVAGGGQAQGVIDPNYVHTDNNFTNAEQSKLAGIAAGAEVNVQADWEESNSSSDAYILNKPEYLASFATLVNALATDGHFVTQNDIITVGGITAQDIQNWNGKADAATTLSGYNIIYDQAVFEEDENDIFTLNAQYKVDHPVRMTSGDNQWTTDGDNKVPTVAAVYNKFLTKDDSTVVKTVGDQTIDGNKTFSKRLNVLNLRSTQNNTQASNKFFATDGTIGTLKTVNGESIVGSGNINCQYSNFTAPSQSTAGITGLVPAPAAGTQNYILTADGWKSPEELGYVTRQQVRDMINEVLGWESSYIEVQVHSNYPGITTDATARILCVTNRVSGEKYILTTDGTTRGFIYYMVVGTSTTEWTAGDNSQYDFEYPENYVNDAQYGLSGVKAYSQFAYMFN